MGKLFGYAGRVLRIDLSDRKVEAQPLKRSLAASFLGGRGFNSKRLFDEVEEGTDPLGPENRIFLATGPLVGTMFPTASRLNVSAKSPQTSILGDSNAGGHLAAEVKYAGCDQIILEGRSREPVYVYIADSKVEFMDAARAIDWI
jgi:aldehyde:ferredoxin oxidoreductase